MMRATFLLAMSVTACQTALASQTLCTFSASRGDDYYEVEFIGEDEAHPQIVFSATVYASGQRFPLDAADVSLRRLRQKEAGVSLTYRQSREGTLPPAFHLDGTNGHARLTIGGKAVEGTLSCGS